jgi:hypothetical protein
MGSSNPAKGSFQSEELAILQVAFDSVWATLVARRPSQENNGELKTALSEEIFSFAACGLMDAEWLRSTALANFGLPELAAE